MKYSIIFSGLLIISLCNFSCGHKQVLPDRRLITEIIVETIIQDSLDSSIFINTNLVNRYSYQQEFDNDLDHIPPPPRNDKGEPFVFCFYKSITENSLGFNQLDSSFVAEQVLRNRNINLELKILPQNYKFKSIPVFNNNGLRFYNFLVPLFNIKKDLAIVEYDYECPGCGNGRIAVFRKIKGEWIKTESFRTWIN